jgi:nitrogen fixation protein FixH
MKSSRNFWPLGIILTFVIFISGTVSLVVMACRQRVDLVNANYYDQEIRYQSHIDSQFRAQMLGAKASITYDASLKRIIVSLPEEQTRAGISGQIELYRPSMAGLDHQFALDVKDSHAQSIDASALQPGLWKVRAIWTANNQEYSLDQRIVIPLIVKTAVVSAKD